MKRYSKFNLLASAFLLSLTTQCFSSHCNAETTTYKLNTDSSLVHWVGEKVTGSHKGTLSIKSGDVLFDKDKLVGGTFEIAMGTIKNVDIEDPKYNKKLIDHLNSDDFFNTSNFPVATFKITNTEKLTSDDTSKNNYTISGDMTIKGLTFPISFPASVNLNGDKATAKASTKVDRTKFNIRYGSGKFFDNLGDKLIYDEFTVELDLESQKA
jgi:polyisoprenoid-binding protein YceI